MWLVRRAPRPSLPEGDDLEAEVERLNQFVREGALRTFQRDLMVGGSFRVGGVRPSASVLLDAESVAYRFVGRDTSYWLVSRNFSRGLPLSLAYYPRGRRVVPLGPEPHLVTDEVVEHVLSTFRPVGRQMWWPWRRWARRRLRPVVALGHPNFAHMIWNELPGLLAAPASAGPLVLLPACEALGPFEQLAPGLDLRVLRDEPREPRQASVRRAYVRPGSVLVTREAKQAVLATAARHLGPEAAALEQRLRALPGPRIWVSIRTDLRTATNQDAFLAELLSAFVAAYPAAHFLLDGFSLAEDFDTSPVYDDFRDHFAGRIQRDRDFIDGVLARVPDLADRVTVLPGLRLLDTIHLTGLADYYVCHEGTIHHKIGWLRDVPGFLHFRPQFENHAMMVARWHANMSEGAVPPGYPEVDDVELVESAQTAVARNNNYRFRNPDRLAARVVAHSREWLT